MLRCRQHFGNEAVNRSDNKKKSSANRRGSFFMSDIIFVSWCSLRDSNPRPPPCDGDALPTELSEPKKKLVGLTELESVTSSMSTRHSNHLSYNPMSFKTSAIIDVQSRTVKKNFYRPGNMSTNLILMSGKLLTN